MTKTPTLSDQFESITVPELKAVCTSWAVRNDGVCVLILRDADGTPFASCAHSPEDWQVVINNLWTLLAKLPLCQKSSASH
jgi:hypothetical protein